MRYAVTDEVRTMPAMFDTVSRVAADVAEIVPMLVPTSQIGALLVALMVLKIA